MIHTELDGCAADLTIHFTIDDLTKDDAVDKIISVMYKRNALIIISDVYMGFSTLLNTKRGRTETFKNLNFVLQHKLKN